MEDEKTAWCKACDKPAKSWGSYLTSSGWKMSVTCHGETEAHELGHKAMKRRMPKWMMQSLFQKFEFRKRRSAT